MRNCSSEIKSNTRVLGLYNDVPMPPFISFLDPQVKVPPKEPWLNEGLPIELSRPIRITQMIQRLPPLTIQKRLVDFLVVVLLSLPASGFENQIPTAINFGATEVIPSQYTIVHNSLKTKSFPHDIHEMNFAKITKIPPKIDIQNKCNTTDSSAVNKQINAQTSTKRYHPKKSKSANILNARNKRQSLRMSPYAISTLFRSRRDSVNSNSSSDYSQPSPSFESTSYTNSMDDLTCPSLYSHKTSLEHYQHNFLQYGKESYVLNKLKTMVNDNTNKDLFKIIVKVASEALDVGEISHECNMYSSIKAHNKDSFPEDLLDVDVSAFQKMLSTDK